MAQVYKDPVEEAKRATREEESKAQERRTRVVSGGDRGARELSTRAGPVDALEGGAGYEKETRPSGETASTAMQDHHSDVRERGKEVVKEKEEDLRYL